MLHTKKSTLGLDCDNFVIIGIGFFIQTISKSCTKTLYLDSYNIGLNKCSNPDTIENSNFFTVVGFVQSKFTQKTKTYNRSQHITKGLIFHSFVSMIVAIFEPIETRKFIFWII